MTFERLLPGNSQAADTYTFTDDGTTTFAWDPRGKLVDHGPSSDTVVRNAIIDAGTAAGGINKVAADFLFRYPSAGSGYRWATAPVECPGQPGGSNGGGWIRMIGEAGAPIRPTNTCPSVFVPMRTRTTISQAGNTNDATIYVASLTGANGVTFPSSGSVSIGANTSNAASALVAYTGTASDAAGGGPRLTGCTLTAGQTNIVTTTSMFVVLAHETVSNLEIRGFTFDLGAITDLGVVINQSIIYGTKVDNSFVKYGSRFNVQDINILGNAFRNAAPTVANLRLWPMHLAVQQSAENETVQNTLKRIRVEYNQALPGPRFSWVPAAGVHLTNVNIINVLVDDLQVNYNWCSNDIASSADIFQLGWFAQIGYVEVIGNRLGVGQGGGDLGMEINNAQHGIAQRNYITNTCNGGICFINQRPVVDADSSYIEASSNECVNTTLLDTNSTTFINPVTRFISSTDWPGDNSFGTIVNKHNVTRDSRTAQRGGAIRGHAGYFGDNTTPCVARRIINEGNQCYFPTLSMFSSGQHSGICLMCEARNATFSTNLTGADNDLTFTSVNKNFAANSITVTYVVAGLNTALSISVTGTDITVNVATDGAGAPTSTGNAILAALNADVNANVLITTSLKAGNTGAGVVTAMAKSFLTGGSDTAMLDNSSVKAEFDNNHVEWSASFNSGTPLLTALVFRGPCHFVNSKKAVTSKLALTGSPPAGTVRHIDIGNSITGSSFAGDLGWIILSDGGGADTAPQGARWTADDKLGLPFPNSVWFDHSRSTTAGFVDHTYVATSVAGGIFFDPLSIPKNAITEPTITLGGTNGTGTLNSTNTVTAATGTWYVGQGISHATLIPAGTTVTAVSGAAGALTLTMSAAATGNASGTNLLNVSPFIWQSTDGYPRYVNVAGGTVSAIGIIPDAQTATAHATGATAGLFRLQPGVRIKVTYTGAPTMTTWADILQRVAAKNFA